MKVSRPVYAVYCYCPDDWVRDRYADAQELLNGIRL